MIHRSIGILATAYVVVSAGAAETNQDPKQIIRQAITAMGGIENARQIRALHIRLIWRLKTAPDDVVEVKGETWQQFPDRLKHIWQIDADKSIGCIVRGHEGWMIRDGIPRPMEQWQRARVCVDLHAERVAALWPLLEDQSFTLTTVPVKIINGKPARGVRIAKANQPNVTLYFDQETHLLVQKQRLRLDPENKDRSTLDEEVISDYRTIDFTARRPTELALRIVRRTS